MCNLREKSIVYYDPIGIENNDKDIKSALFTFLKKEINFDDQIGQNNFIRKFIFKNVTESEVYDHVDSGVYVMKQVYRVAVDKRMYVAPQNINEFRLKILYLLFKYGTNVIY